MVQQHLQDALFPPLLEGLLAGLLHALHLQGKVLLLLLDLAQDALLLMLCFLHYAHDVSSLQTSAKTLSRQKRHVQV